MCACRRRSDIPSQGGQYVLTVVSRHCIACETLTARESSYKQVSISHICSGLVPQSQAITTTSQSPETHLKGIKPNVIHCHTYATCTLMPLHHACVPWRLVMQNAAESPCTFSSSRGDSLTSSLHALPWQPCSTAFTEGTKRLRIMGFLCCDTRQCR